MTSSDADRSVSRRRFLAATTGAAALKSAPAGAAPSETGPIIVNALGGLENPNLELSRQIAALPDATLPGVDDRAIRDALASGVTAVNVTLGYVAGPMDPFDYTIRSIGAWDRVIRTRSNALLKVDAAADIRRAKAEGKVGVIYGFQNAVQIGDRLDRVDTFGDLGVSIIQLTYNPPNSLGDGSMSPLNRGLTPFGRAVVERLNANRIMVDLSHSGERTCLDALAVSKQPISINHTGCRALTDLPRNKTDAELRGVAQSGGFVGIYFMPYLSRSGHAGIDDVLAHIDHAVSVCGEDHVGIGTDGSVTQIDDLGLYQSRLAAEIAGRAKAGIGATGERSDTYPFVVEMRGVDQFRILASRLKGRGYTATRIEKILGGNFLRYAATVWGR